MESFYLLVNLFLLFIGKLFSMNLNDLAMVWEGIVMMYG